MLIIIFSQARIIREGIQITKRPQNFYREDLYRKPGFISFTQSHASNHPVIKQPPNLPSSPNHVVDKIFITLPPNNVADKILLLLLSLNNMAA